MNNILLMIQIVWESYLRAVIRFWDNRFHRRDNPIEFYHEEINYLRRRNEELQGFILNNIYESVEPQVEQTLETEFQTLGKPIETLIQRRKRLESQSLVEWNKLVQEAKNKQAASATSKTTEQLEEDLGVKN